MDRAISSFFPKVMAEKPELKEAYTGFVYYPYTVSFACTTLYSAPSLLGGYEYTPLKLQNDTTRKMVDKHNEAISVLPEMFRRNGYKATLFDVPYINYWDRSKERFYHKDISVIETGGNQQYRTKEEAAKIKKNMFYFMLFKRAMQAYKNLIYNFGKYAYFKKGSFSFQTTTKIHYDKLKKFITKLGIREKNQNTFILFVSMLTHSPLSLTPDYDFPEDNLDRNIQGGDNKMHYDVNMLLS